MALLLIYSCTMQWVYIASKQIVVTGLHSEGTSFGGPGYLHIIFAVISLILLWIPRVGAKRVNLFVVALNLAWAIRNYMLMTACHAGECPETRLGFYILLLSSILLLVVSFFPDLKEKV